MKYINSFNIYQSGIRKINALTILQVSPTMSDHKKRSDKVNWIGPTKVTAQ